MSNTPKLQERFGDLEAALNYEVLERTREVHAALNALVSRSHFFIIGPPGTAKSFLVRRLADRVEGLGHEGYFQWLLTRYSTPEEIFGPPSLPDLEQGRYRRRIEGKLPVAKLAFLDEIFKANSSILNALLTIINERLFFNDDGHDEVPLSSLFAASNEMPADEGLHALWDRLHFRFQVGPIREGGNFIQMLKNTEDLVPESTVTWDNVLAAQMEAAAVTIPGDIYEALHVLRGNLYKAGVEPTERRFKESLGIIQAEAWLEGRDMVEMDDLRILRHVMWYRPEDQKTVQKTVLELANPIDREAHDLIERIEELEADLDRAIREGDGPKAVAKQAVEIHHKLSKAKNRKDDLEKRMEEHGRKSDVLDDLEKRFVALAKKLMQEGFGMDGDPIV